MGDPLWKALSHLWFTFTLEVCKNHEYQLHGFANYLWYWEVCMLVVGCSFPWSGQSSVDLFQWHGTGHGNGLYKNKDDKGLAQDCSNSIANVLELLQSYGNSSMNSNYSYGDIIVIIIYQLFLLNLWDPMCCLEFGEIGLPTFCPSGGNGEWGDPMK